MKAIQLKAKLTRPALPAVDERLHWPGTLVCVVGRDASRFAEATLRRLREQGVPARGMRVELRHAEGSALERAAFEGARSEDAVLRANPDALVAALADARPSEQDGAITIGAGLALAAAATPDLLVWIRAGESLLALGERERAIVSEAALVLEEPREETARALADTLAGTGHP